MAENTDLKFDCLAIGSLPHKDIDKAMAVVRENFNSIPFWPQLPKISKNEDMTIQFLENMPSFFLDKESGKIYLETESDKFFDDIEKFFEDYEEIVADINSDKLDKYAINYSLSFPKFLDIVKETKPKYAKGQIVGPFTLSTTLVDKSGKYAIYDETLREIIIKTLSIKALWQIKQIRKTNKNTIPIIFIDEPSISQLGTSAFITISQEEVVQMLKEISDLIKANGAMSAIHCCGKCDWIVPINAKVDIINLDAYAYAKNLSLFSSNLKEFLQHGGKIAWGVVPTLNCELLEKADLDKMFKVFEKAVKYLTEKGIDEKIVLENSLITPSCGAGALSEDLALKAMRLTKQLSDNLKERYKF